MSARYEVVWHVWEAHGATRRHRDSQHLVIAGSEHEAKEKVKSMIRNAGQLEDGVPTIRRIHE